MQFDGRESFVTTCLGSLRSAVMGCCVGCLAACADHAESEANERTVLLPASEQTTDVPVPVVSAATPPKKPDEQTALNRILHETASNVIDVGALGPYTLDAAACGERLRAYAARLSAAPPPARAPPPRLLRDVPHAERAGLLARAPLSHADRDLISSAVKCAAAAMSELRVEHHEELVVPFRVP